MGWKMHGQQVCQTHGGRTRQAKFAAQKKLQAAAAAELAQRAMRSLGEPTPIDPAEAILKMIAFKNGEVMWLHMKVQEVEPADLVWSETKREEGATGEGDDGAGYRNIVTTEARPSVWYVMYEKAQKDLVDFSSKAIKAGIAERQIKLAESQGQMVSQVIRVILADLILTPAQESLVPVVVPRALRAIAGSMV